MVSYGILGKLGEGGMGEIYMVRKYSEGIDLRICNVFVLKVLKKATPEKEEEFLIEANLATYLKESENIVKTYGTVKVPKTMLEEYEQNPYEVITDNFYPTLSKKNLETILEEFSLPVTQDLKKGDFVYAIEMEYIDGTDLKALQSNHIKKGLLIPIPITTYVVYKVLKGLSYAHKIGIIHRDISPDNIMINKEGVPKLADFGIAVAAGAVEKFAGKLNYASPEQLKNLKKVLDKKEPSPLDFSTDIYSLGIVFYELLTGINPLIDSSAEEELSYIPDNQLRLYKAAEYLLNEKIYPRFLRPHNIRSDIPKELSEIIMKMLDPDPDERYKRVEEVRNDLLENYRALQLTNEETLETYLNLFLKDFKEIKKSDKIRLISLRNESNKIQLKRIIPAKTKTGEHLYTEKGLELIKKTHKGLTIYKVIKQTLKDAF